MRNDPRVLDAYLGGALDDEEFDDAGDTAGAAGHVGESA